MKTKATALLLSLAVAGCVTTADMEARAPVFTGQTLKPAPQYAGCVQQGWLDGVYLAVNYIPTGEGVRLSTQGMSGYELLMDITHGPNGNQVVLRSRVMLNEQKYVDVAWRCL